VLRRRRDDAILDVCSTVVSDLRFDARVWKEARVLRRMGLSVALVGLTYEIDGTQRRTEEGIQVTEVPFGSRSNVTRRGRVLSMLRLWREILRTRAGVYHCHNIHPAPAVWLATRLRGGRIVYDAHELYGDPGRDPSPLRRIVAWGERRLEAFIVARSERLITTNPGRARLLTERYGRDDVIVLPNVPQRLDEVRPLDPGYPEGAPIVLYQGGIYPEYGIAEAIDATALLDDVHLAILGFGRTAELERLRDRAAAAGVADRVHFYGPRPFDELPRTAAAADLGLVPVKPLDVNLELGDTNKIHDYLMGGLPVVASDLPEIRRIVESGNPPVGELFDPASPESIAAAIERALADPELHAARRKEARRLALEETNWENVAPRLVALYEELIPAA
jgi:glycosyltransferase involved in cell wall biosynthesis